MKKFFTVIPLQPKGMLKKTAYDTKYCPTLAIDMDTCFPIIHLMISAAQKGEHIILYALRSESPLEEVNQNIGYNLSLLEGELDLIQQVFGFVCDLHVLTLPKIETPSAQSQYFLKLMELFQKDDELYCCITYGEKPMPIVLFTALSYASLTREGFHVARICYGQFEHIGQQVNSVLYDVTPLFSMHHLATDAVRFGIDNPDLYVKAALSLAMPERMKDES